MNTKKIIILSFLIGIIFFSVTFYFSDKRLYFKLNGDSIVNVNIGKKYKEDGFIAEYCSKNYKLFCKNIKNKVKVDSYVSKDFNTEYISYRINYKGKEQILVRKINYKDTESPTITLIDNKKSVCPNKEYVEEGYTAKDNIDGDITDKVLISKIDNIIYYTVSDNAGNKKVVYRTIKYSDNTSPTITLNGQDKTYVFINQEYNEAGVTAYDDCDGDLSSKVKINGKVDINKKGEYNIKYTVSDNSGNITNIKRKVIVYDDASKVIKNGKNVYLTFDDGPCIYTNDILKVLDKYKVKATFFVTNQFSDYNNLIKKEYKKGHTVAVHTYSHDYSLIYSSLDNYINDFNLMNNIIYEQTGTYSKIFRFPGGSSNTISRFNKGIVTQIANKMNELGYYYFDWNIDSNDTRTTDPKIIYESVINEIGNYDNSVILMHDIKKANIESVDMIIKYGLDNGYTFLPLNESSPQIRHTINN